MTAKVIISQAVIEGELDVTKLPARRVDDFYFDKTTPFEEFQHPNLVERIECLHPPPSSRNWPDPAVQGYCQTGRLYGNPLQAEILSRVGTLAIYFWQLGADASTRIYLPHQEKYDSKEAPEVRVFCWRLLVSNITRWEVQTCILPNGSRCRTVTHMISELSGDHFAKFPPPAYCHLRAPLPVEQPIVLVMAAAAAGFRSDKEQFPFRRPSDTGRIIPMLRAFRQRNACEHGLSTGGITGLNDTQFGKVDAAGECAIGTLTGDVGDLMSIRRPCGQPTICPDFRLKLSHLRQVICIRTKDGIPAVRKTMELSIGKLKHCGPFWMQTKHRRASGLKRRAKFDLLQGNDEVLPVGGQAQRKLYPNLAHDPVVYGSLKDQMEWIADRFAGKPAPSDCSAQ